MKDRIRQIMESENLTPSEFADKLHIGRAVISHILNGRNNPSLDVVTRILTDMENINPDWLLKGNGSMYKDEKMVNYDKHQNAFDLFSSHATDLFSQNNINKPEGTAEPENRKENIVNQPEIQQEQSVKQDFIYKKTNERKISKIIIYYSDNTFETFNADNRPL